MAQVSIHAFHFSGAETVTYKTPTASGSSEWWLIETYKPGVKGNRRAYQRAKQIYAGARAGLIFERTRHYDNDDFSQWSEWISLWNGLSLPVETGAWTPSIAGYNKAGTHTYGFQHGQYTRIGKLVYYSASLSLTAKDTSMDGWLFLTGLPFTPYSTNGGMRYINRSVSISGLTSGLIPNDYGLYENFNTLGLVFSNFNVNSTAFTTLSESTITDTFV